ncbi:hypothetical protein CAPTEDRAFT_218503 [Capitella teleta]|uniref:Choline O-acetyltransferase n=1 Tax=Capitella teleta TaxID=283909 RepID=R7VIW1_CAPTE|nr:hypothetical protein CAPTEDRAFT_218503 [Capitella teleta]|eukprot:ELU18773.1 hypothetical protein CAPTEDRAFT_218503 [Capitella teleta]
MSQKEEQVKIKSHPLLAHAKQMASLDEEQFPQWDPTKPLAKLPVPDLHETMRKYLLCIKAVVPSDQYKVTEQLVEEFVKPGGQGEILQEKLIQYARTQDNWVTKFWLDDMYMNIRLPLPVNSNPGMVFPRQQFEDQSEQLRFAARLISVVLDYKDVIDSKSLPVDRCRHREKGQPLCMEQYYRLFSSYRAPGVDKDCLHTRTDEKSNHCIVAINNQFFVLNVLAHNQQRLSNDNLYAQLKRIVKMATEAEDGDVVEIDANERVGILTAAKRDLWAKARNEMLLDPVNKASLEWIESCMFILCLDKSLPLSFNHQQSVDETCKRQRDDVSLAMQTIHGHGAQHNSANRWHEKTMQFIIGQDGACGLCYEHSASEGIAVVQLIEQLLNFMDDAKRRKLTRLLSLCDLPPPKRLEWRLAPKVKDAIMTSTFDLDRSINNMDLYVLRFDQYGKNFPKSQNMSPDAYIQIALQLTYYKVHGRLVSTYESASIRRFRLGRVDNIRANTVEALEWCEAMTGRTTATTILGYGIDNHLLGLRCMSEMSDMDKPEVFKDESFNISNHFTLSTSQVPTTLDAFMCYGPVVPDGYGACYNPHEDYILVVISSFKSCDQTGSDSFAFTLEESFLQMKELCESTKEAGLNGRSSCKNAQADKTAEKKQIVPDVNQNCAA